MSWKIQGDDLKGLKKLQANMQKLRNMRVKVGVLKGAGAYSTGESVVSVALKHEFGSESPQVFSYKGQTIRLHGIPTRSFLRMPLRMHARTLAKMDDVDKGMLLEGLRTGYLQHPLYRLGLKGEAIVQKAFDSQGFGQWPRNINEEYIELKGSDTPLINYGVLRHSITSEVYEV